MGGCWVHDSRFSSSYGSRLGVTRAAALLLPLALLIHAAAACEPRRDPEQSEYEAAEPASAAPTRGAPEPVVELVVFGDLGDPAYPALYGVLRRILDRHPESVALTFRHLPAGTDPDAWLPHRAVLAAGDQSHFWEMHDVIVARGGASRRDVLQTAQALALDIPRFQRVEASASVRDRIKLDARIADELHVERAPTLLVDGRKVTGVPSWGDLAALVERALEQNRQGGAR